jgi:hypothetical protein
MHFDDVTSVQDELGSLAADVKYSQFGGKSHVFVQSSMKVGVILTNGAKSKLGETCHTGGRSVRGVGGFWGNPSQGFRGNPTAGFPWRSQEIQGFSGGNPVVHEPRVEER